MDNCLVNSWQRLTRIILMFVLLLSISPFSLYSDETLASSKTTTRSKKHCKKKIRPKVMVLTTFLDEFDPWKKNLNLHLHIDVPGIDAPIYYNRQGLYVMIMGETIPNCCNQLSCLLLDDRFDFRKTYWVFAGIAGVNPLAASISSVAWTRFIVNGDTAMEVDARQMPAGWPYGILQVYAPAPNVPTAIGPPYDSASLTFTLNESFAAWAYNLTKDISLPYTAAIREANFAYDNPSVKVSIPKVLLGDVLSSNRYWYGSIMTQWASDWVTFCTNGLGHMIMNGEEGYGIADWFKRFGRIGKVDYNRFLFLRGGTDYTFAPNLVDTGDIIPSIYQQTVANIFNVANPVVQELIQNYSSYKDHIPGSP